MTVLRDLEARLLLSPYQAYSYSYPHKTAYRALDPPVDLAPVWAAEDRSRLFLYLHVPFCEMRCGFCNLFTLVKPEESLPERYVAALERQARVMTELLGNHAVARIAIGGGTPTRLTLRQMERMLAVARGMAGPGVPLAVEVSPDTVDEEKIALLAAQGTTRLSMGVQSFIESELRALARPQSEAQVERAMTLIRAAAFPLVNLDLIYGIPGQSLESWLVSLERALAYAPDELYLYPLYIRPLTGLGKREESRREAPDQRRGMYRAARERLLAAGWSQASMRLFRAPGAAVDGPAYSCQEDGMVGLGAGARSYTRGLHYSTDFAVGRRSIEAIIEGYCQTSEEGFARTNYGVRLDLPEQKRRFIIQSVLDGAGLDVVAYRRRFGSAAEQDFPELAALESLDLARRRGETLALTTRGIESADIIGPWLVSGAMAQRMAGFVLR